jgi:SAM-dependent methyltransferase
MFRFPRDRKSTAAAEDYRLSLEHKVSYLPKAQELAQLKQKAFKETIYDISTKIELIKRYLTKGHMLDYGASWGYNLWQFLEEGFSGVGYEVSPKRATFGEKNLGLKIIHDPAVLDALESHFDIVFANHVLEHCQDIKKELNRIYRVMKTGGFLIIYVPDCTNIEKEKWRNIYAFGQTHPLAFGQDFFKKNLPRLGFRLLEVGKWEKPEYAIMVIAKKEH